MQERIQNAKPFVQLSSNTVSLEIEETLTFNNT